MTKLEEKVLIELINDLRYGEIVIKKEAGKIVVIKKTESIKLSGEILLRSDPSYVKNSLRVGSIKLPE
ncbi:MAG: hypothetical protein WBC22_13210 [Sedimentisphaerales bacterium]